MPKLTMMCGLPRCGKTTWSRKNRPDSVVVCPDEIRKEIFGHQFHGPVEGLVWAFAQGMARMLLLQNRDVLLDATNVTASRRAPWIRLVNELQCELEVVLVATEFGTCVERNNGSPEGEKVPEDVLDRMRQSFEYPARDETGVDPVEVY